MATEAQLKRVLDVLTKAPKSQIEALRPAASTHAKSLRKVVGTKNVVAVGISEKVSKKKPTGKLALTFYVEKKIPTNKLKADAFIPPTVPEALSGPQAIPTDVVVLGKLSLEVNVTRQPLQPGNSIGHVDISAGTLGALAKRDGNVFFLSNSHVLADSGTGKKGDTIVYPGIADGGKDPGDAVGALERFKAFVSGGQFVNRVDCAIAKPNVGRQADLVAEIKGLGLPKGVTKPRRGMKVVKVGRTTGKTSGEIRDVNFRFVLDYGGSVGEVGFVDQVLCTRYTKPGDSGSLVLDQKTGRAVGLHFAGANGGSVFNPIGEVLKALNVSLVTKTLGGGEKATKVRGSRKRSGRRRASKK